MYYVLSVSGDTYQENTKDQKNVLDFKHFQDVPPI